MEKRKPAVYSETARKVERIRKLYSKIGEPLPADVIIDLYRHLGKIPQRAIKA